MPGNAESEIPRGFPIVFQTVAVRGFYRACGNLMNDFFPTLTCLPMLKTLTVLLNVLWKNVDYSFNIINNVSRIYDCMYGQNNEYSLLRFYNIIILYKYCTSDT